MKKGGLLLVVCVSLYVRSAPTDSEMVWLKDVTTSFQTDKRTIGDLDLPDDLTFHLSRRSEALTLNLRRNHEIDPNAAIYVVRKLKDGRSSLKKTLNLEKEDVAYYQDWENGAFMTVRCVKRSSGQCDRVINGNIRIEERNYDLRPAETDITSRNLLDVPDLLGTRYVLHDQANVQRDISVKRKDAANVNEETVEQKLKNRLRRFSHGQKNQKHFPFPNSILSPRHVTGLDKRDKPKQVYRVKIDVLIDEGLWALFSNLKQTNNAPIETGQVEQKIREFFSHIINGVNLLYKGIEDTSIQISVRLRAFHIFQTSHDFPHKKSMRQTVEGIDSIDAYDYLRDLAPWVKKFSPRSDHVMLFTRYQMYDNSAGDYDVHGLSFMGYICHRYDKISVVQVRDTFLTVSTAAHELGHNLGADHDGDGNAKDCKAADLCIMSPNDPLFDKAAPYSRNPWIFSKCSVEVFKDELKNKTCLTNIGAFYNKQEWMTFVKKLPGEVYSLNEQCEFINGPNSVFYGTVSADICRFMTCKDPKTGQLKLSSAARGTRCGENMVQNAVCQKKFGLLQNMVKNLANVYLVNRRIHDDFQTYLHEYRFTMDTSLN